jgi:hypothetical protein
VVLMRHELITRLYSGTRAHAAQRAQFSQFINQTTRAPQVLSHRDLVITLLPGSAGISPASLFSPPETSSTILTLLEAAAPVTPALPGNARQRLQANF